MMRQAAKSTALLTFVFGLPQFVICNEAVVNPNGHVQQLYDNDGENYGVDRSWPMHYSKKNGERQPEYDEYIEGCKEQSDTCQDNENDRIEMNLLQPKAMQNYTHAGYAKVHTPDVVRAMLREVWETHEEKQEEELWDRGNTYVNHWECPTYMLDINKYLSKPQIRRMVKEVQSTLEAWTQQPLVLTSLYGIRVYTDGSILAPHVDRLPLVSSAIINVAQDVDEPWTLEVISHDGVAHNVTMKPGEMILYESHSVIHGRPYPLQGEYYANLFCHFEPIGHTLRHSEKGAYGTDYVNQHETAKEIYEKAWELQLSKSKGSSSAAKKGSSNAKGSVKDQSKTPELPPYVRDDMKTRWQQQYDFEKVTKVSPKPTRKTLGTNNIHHAAADGLMDVIKEIASKDRSQLFKRDANGWRPLHEAARSGHSDIVEYLLKEGAQINERTNDGRGGNPLYWAEKGKSEKHKDCAKLLKKYGAVKLAPNN